jgi:hypothetical protein
MTTKKKETGATLRQDEAAFKAEAVRLRQSSRRSAEKTTHEPGISGFNLYNWKREGAAPRAAGALGPSASREGVRHGNFFGEHQDRGRTTARTGTLKPRGYHARLAKVASHRCER